jgi:regulator of protease activity HflC (stomatin/prohibitin superfamily)
MTAFRRDSDEPSSFREIDMSRLRAGVGRRIVKIAIGIFAFLLLWNSVARVPTGHVGVLTLFDRVTGDTIGEGLHLINPLAAVKVLTVRTQEKKEAASVPSNEGLIMTLDTSLLFRLDAAKAAEVFKTIGPRYIEVVVEPNFRSAVRGVTATHSANALYSGGREEVQDKIREQLSKELGARGIIVEALLLRDVQLPPMLKASIESKQQAEQESLRMSFILQKEKQEAERKRIEAQGIADFQRIVAQGISAQLLEWKGIEATEKLASSPNSKVVVIGAGKSGLPLILGSQ